MAKGDSSRAQHAIDTYGPAAQNYLSSVQNQIGQQASNASSIYYGPQQNYAGGQVTKQPQQPINQAGSSYYNVPPPPQGVNEQIQAIIQQNGLKANQSDPASLKIIADGLKAQGINAEVDKTDENGHTGGITIDGHPYQLIDGSNNWTQLQPWDTSDGGGGIAGQALKDYQNIMGQYQDWAKTGGYSAEDLANIRARAVSPIRSIYSSAREGIERQKALQGGYAPNYDAAMAKMAREQGYATSDASTNTEAAIAELVNRGKQFGMGGMSGMFGTTPGMANMFGNQMLAGQGNLLQSAGLQNQLGLGLIGAQINKGANVPGNTSQIIGNIGRVAPIFGGIAGAFG